MSDENDTLATLDEQIDGLWEMYADADIWIDRMYLWCRLKELHLMRRIRDKISYYVK